VVTVTVNVTEQGQGPAAGAGDPGVVTWAGSALAGGVVGRGALISSSTGVAGRGALVHDTRRVELKMFH
jgi:hypothetical protein